MIKTRLGLYAIIFLISSFTHATTASQQQLTHFLHSKDAIANHVVVDSINKRSVLVNEGSSSSSSRFIYFLKTRKNQFYVNEVLGKTETSAILNQFAVRNLQLTLQESLDVGYELQDQIQENLHYSSAFEIQNALTAQQVVEISMGKIGHYEFLMRYQQLEEFANRTPQYVVRCQQHDYYLAPKYTIYMGYEQPNLTHPQYIVIQDQQQYREVNADQLERAFQQSGISCAKK